MITIEKMNDFIEQEEKVAKMEAEKASKRFDYIRTIKSYATEVLPSFKTKEQKERGIFTLNVFIEEYASKYNLPNPITEVEL